MPIDPKNTSRTIRFKNYMGPKLIVFDRLRPFKIFVNHSETRNIFNEFFIESSMVLGEN